MFSDAVKPVTTETFRLEVLQANQPVFVDFWGTHCGPCKMLAPQIEELARLYGDKIKFVAVEIDSNKELARQLNLRSVPTLRLYHSGALVNEAVGMTQFPAIVAALQSTHRTQTS